MRQFNVLDRCLHEVDKAMRTMVIPERRHSKRPTPGENPAQKSIDKHLTATEKKHIAGLMRINHAGEVCAQGLYQGQALTAKLDRIRAKLEQAANEENEHLAWCEQRLKELKSQPSPCHRHPRGAPVPCGRPSLPRRRPPGGPAGDPGDRHFHGPNGKAL